MAGRGNRKKRLLRTPMVQWLASWLICVIIRTLYFSCRKTYEIPSGCAPYVAGDLPAVFCFWHGRMIMQPFMKPPKRPAFILSSHHNDGTLIVATMRRFGIDAVRGSPNMGAAKAVRALMRVTQQKGNLSLTPDGPRGPFQTAAQGAAFIAQKAHYPLVPVAFSATRCWRFNSWDKFILPKPFSRLVFTLGLPFYVEITGNDAVANATTKLQQALNAVTAQADQLSGILP